MNLEKHKTDPYKVVNFFKKSQKKVKIKYFVGVNKERNVLRWYHIRGILDSNFEAVVLYDYDSWEGNNCLYESIF